MVVKHTQSNSNCIIAIECDESAYRSAKSARDRRYLRKLDWKHIHRIRSTDWFKRREQEE
ncbi:hypothetical protein [Candidatus Liberibacter asiaticus]|uniref:hypothetical protein n=1 Tax=Liberibacter asiaticus TaxID=34021 RepID=UPI003CCAD607